LFLLDPLPLFSWRSLREVFTMGGGRFPLIRYDDNGNPSIGPDCYGIMVLAVIVAAIVYGAVTTRNRRAVRKNPRK
jgi:hypothetical protein